MTAEGEKPNGRITRQALEPRSLDALTALVATERGIPGVTARTKKPKDRHGQRFVEVEATPEGQDWLSRIADHPYTRALVLMLDAQRYEEDLDRNGTAMTKVEAHKKRHTMIGLKENAAKLLGESGSLPILSPDGMRAIIGDVVVQLQTPK